MSKTLTELYETLNLNKEQTNAIEDSAFPFKVPSDFLQQIAVNDFNDPLLKQVLPSKQELTNMPGFTADPVGDLLKNPTPSLIHKYHGRVLLIASPKCDIHCRYCFRRHFPYEEHSNLRHWQKALDQIAKDKSIHEVILSGGDPMSLNEAALLRLIESIEQIKHIKTLRIHSRTPIVSPSSAPQKALLTWSKQSRLNKVLVVHCNHANELSDKTQSLLELYRVAGFQLLNQSVLLKDINDTADRLIELSHKLFEQGVLPYYLHQLDRVQGASHFEVDDNKAKALMEEIRSQLPGYLVPKLVREIAGEANKTPI
ncbi:EF-P beta-lysylation protein EpmB [Thiomicrorhabdus sp. Kp2]|uniref:EF-P beta-lysylation protein EpmB n=1 Tax=Thiomicrorhabdus sp. Kp2 TaxID=1123518 RepID=UPI0004147A49|nr:EF-P beta-lysylation protein EpmB [Thiomicrorhabdus sp. Kp2]